MRRRWRTPGASGSRRGKALLRLERWRRWLHAGVPVLGPVLRILAFRRVSACLREGNPAVIPLMVEVADSPGSSLAPRAGSLLRGLSDPVLQDALCHAAIRAPGSRAAAICREQGWRPSDPEDECLFLFVTRQLESYFEEDFAFQNLRLAYDRASPDVKANVMDVVRSGDRRCLGFFGSRKRLSECSDREIRLALQSYRRHGDWPRLFQAFLELPVKYGLHILRELRRAGWEPEEPELRSLLRQALTDTQNRFVPQTLERRIPSALWDRALERGRQEPLSRLQPDELLARLERAPPLEGVSLVVALAARVSPDSAAARQVTASPHWLVRLAAHLTGLSTDVARDELEDPVFWVRELAPSRTVLELWPGRATPVHLEVLSSAPREAWEGGLGAARKVLRALIARRVTAGHFEEMVVEGDAFAAEFEPVSEDDWLE